MTTNYNTQGGVYPKHIIWLVDQQGEILIKKHGKRMKNLSSSDLTVESDNYPNMIKQIELEWGIGCTDENIKEIYNFESSDEKGTIYVLELDLDTELKECLIDKTGGKLIGFQDLDRYIDYSINPEEKEASFLEAFIGLISYLEQRYGLLFSRSSKY